MARKQSVVSSPLKLPKAPDTYSERDQDHTRRLIELALIAYSQQLGGVIKDVAEQTIVGKDFIPVSPIHAGVGSDGDASGTPALLQLTNPLGSGVIMVIYELLVSQNGNANQQIRLMITDVPAIDNGGVITTATPIHRDERNTATIFGTLKGFTKMTPNPPFTTDNSSFWETARDVNQPQNMPVPVIAPGMHPLVLLPGQTLQCASPLTGATMRNTMYACWDELPLSTLIGTAMPNDQTRPVDSIWATMRTNGSVNGAPFIQLFNPGPKYIKVTFLGVIGDGTPNYVAARRTNAPISVAGGGATVLTAKVRRMNGGSISQVTGVLRGTTFTVNGDNFHSNANGGGGASFWRDKGRGTDEGLPFSHVIGVGSGPLIVKPNSAVEVSGGLNGAGLIVGAFFMWDELDSI